VLAPTTTTLSVISIGTVCFVGFWSITSASSFGYGCAARPPTPDLEIGDGMLRRSFPRL